MQPLFRDLDANKKTKWGETCELGDSGIRGRRPRIHGIAYKFAIHVKIKQSTVLLSKFIVKEWSQWFVLGKDLSLHFHYLFHCIGTVSIELNNRHLRHDSWVLSEKITDSIYTSVYMNLSVTLLFIWNIQVCCLKLRHIECNNFLKFRFF